MDVNILRKAIEEFSKINPEANTTMLLIFLFIAYRGVCTQKDLEIHLGLTNATASRGVSWWTEHKRYDQDGVGYVERTEDPRDRRYKLLKLTPSGQKFYERIKRMG